MTPSGPGGQRTRTQRSGLGPPRRHQPSATLTAVVRLRFFEDLKLEEIAQVSDTILNTVKSAV
jgi:hypothetical protein